MYRQYSYKRVFAITLSIIMIFSTLPISAIAEGISFDESEPQQAVTNAVYGKEEEKELFAGGRVSEFEELPDHIRWQNTTAPIFPETVRGTVGGEHTEIPVTWETDQDFDQDYPVRGLYVFRAVPVAEYVLADDPELLIITVFIPETVRGFTVFRMGGSGTTDEPLEITTASQLREIATLVNTRKNGLELFLFNSEDAEVSIKLMNDIDLSAYGENYNGGKGWEPIGKAWDLPFKGSFDGGGHIITGLYIDRPDEDYQGLVGYLQGQVSNTGIVNASIVGNVWVGGVAGRCYGQGSNTPKIQNSFVTGSIRAKDDVGGIAGSMQGGLVDNCYSAADIYGENLCGGLIGLVFSQSTVRNCYATGMVGEKVNAGGVAGYVQESTIENCIALNPIVKGAGYVGRVAGIIEEYGYPASNNYAFSGMTVLNGPATKYIDAGQDKADGADISAAGIKTAGFFEGIFDDSGAWIFEEGKLPILNNFAPSSQNSDMPLHIIDIIGEYFSGDGTEENPYLIHTADQLAMLARLVNEDDSNTTYNNYDIYYKLVADMDLSSYGRDYDSGQGWMTIGKSNAAPFEANFDGDGHIISGLYINRPDTDYIGLFGFVGHWQETTVVKNIGIVNANITGKGTVGILAGTVSDNVTVEKCFTGGSVKGDNYVGGILGSSGGKVQDCYSLAKVDGTQRVGGLVGAARAGIVQNCYSAGTVIGSSTQAGGIVGTLSGAGEEVAIQNCAALGSAVGKNSGPIAVGRIVGSIYSGGTLAGNIAFEGMIVNSTTSTTVTSEDAADNHGLDKSADAINAAGLWTTASNWDGEAAWDGDVWTFADSKLPVLRDINGQYDIMPGHLIPSDVVPFEGSGDSEGDPYLIKTPYDLAVLAHLVNKGERFSSKYFKLEEDLDLSAYGKNYDNGQGWIPIGGEQQAFDGNFDGNNKTISNLYISRSDNSYQGLFGRKRGGELKNLHLENVNVNGLFIVGALAGRAENVKVENSSAEGIITGKSNQIGGLVGNFSEGELIQAYTKGKVSGQDNVGGIIGWGDKGIELKNSYSTARVSGKNYVGGIAGSAVPGTTGHVYKLENCYSSGNITGEERVGGLVGNTLEGSIVNSYSRGNITGKKDVGGIAGYADSVSVENCYSSGEIKGEEFSVGGIAGFIYDSMLKNCAALNPAVSGASFVGRITGSKYRDYTLASNYALNTMVGKVWNDKTSAGLDGQDLTVKEANTAAFWSTASNWDTTDGGTGWSDTVWTLADNKLPVLTNAGGVQVGDGGLYLNPRDIQYVTVQETAYTYTGEPIYPTITFDGQTLVKDIDYSVDITSTDNINDNPTSAGTNAGRVTLTLTGIGNFKGEVSKEFTIDAKELTITADDKLNIIRGSAMPELTYTVVDLVQGGTYDAPIISTTAENTDTVGEYDINIRGGSLSNANSYSVTYLDGRLTIVNAGSGGSSGGSTRPAQPTTSIIDEPQDESQNESQEEIDSKWENSFTDVQEDNWFYQAVRYAYDKGLMRGTATNTFSPNDITTRGMIVTILHKLEGIPVAGVNPFRDVTDDKYYASAAIWASENNIVAGYGNGAFGPEDAITREQLAVILMKYAKLKGYDISTTADLSKYEDAEDISPWAIEAMSWANSQRLIQGDGNNLTPRAYATRAQVAAILYRFMKEIVK